MGHPAPRSALPKPSSPPPNPFRNNLPRRSSEIERRARELAGDIHFDTSTKATYTYNGTSWDRVRNDEKIATLVSVLTTKRHPSEPVIAADWQTIIDREMWSDDRVTDYDLVAEATLALQAKGIEPRLTPPKPKPESKPKKKLPLVIMLMGIALVMLNIFVFNGSPTVTVVGAAMIGLPVITRDL